MNLRKNILQLGALLLAASLAGACAQKKVATDNPSDSTVTGDEVLGSSDTGQAMDLRTVHFAYNSVALSDETKAGLSHNAKILAARPRLGIQIEGHCDHVGGLQYNLALGERRAQSAKSYLETLGIEGDRMTIISYGKEHMIDPGETEEAAAKNRRANFVIVSK